VAEVQEVVPGLYRVPLGVVNAYLLVDGSVTVIDTGTPGSEDKIVYGRAAYRTCADPVREVRSGS